jgi:thiol:disulfide interchange protein DsbD
MRNKIIIAFLFLFTIPLLANSGSLQTQTLFGLLLGAFGAGLLLTFTPCVLPMIPILSSIIAGQGEKVTKKNGLLLSVAYVLGTALTYTIMGALAGATGEQLQAYFQNIWAIGIMSFIFFILALSMFGFFNLQMPSFIQSKLDSETRNIKGGTFFAVFLLGLFSALILGACVSPIIISFLSVAIAQASPVLGAEMMFALSLGMGVPLLLVGLGAGFLLPKAGAWMDYVKYFFGILLLGVAISIFSELELFSALYLWGIYFILIGAFIYPWQTAQNQSLVWQKLLRSLSILSLTWGIITLTGAGMGHTDIYMPLKTQPVQSASTLQAITKTSSLFTDIPNLKALDEKLAEAKSRNKPLFVYFHSRYCKVCKKLDETTFKDPKITKILNEKYIALVVDLSDKGYTDTQAIKEKYGVYGYPAFLMIDSDGTPQTDAIHYGYESAQELFDVLDLNAE